MAEGKTRQDLDRDRKLNLSLARLLEIVGEAANRIPRQDRNRYADIPMVRNRRPKEPFDPWLRRGGLRYSLANSD
jgi:uncharacterized protein with HEPN domain